MLATDPMSRYQYLPLAPQEAYLLSRIDGILDVDSLLKIAGTSRSAMAKILYALVSCGIVEWKQDGAQRPASGRGGFHGLNVEVSAEPADRSPGHAELVKNTYRRIDWLTHYELLGVPREAPPEKIAEAYFERSRLFHPDLRHREDLARFEKELTAVFERMKRAYETLSDPEKRALYDQSLDAAPSPVIDVPRPIRSSARSSPPRISGARGSSSKTRTITRRSRCCARPCASCPTTPNIRYVLSQVELKNPNWTDQGLSNLKEAARLDSRRVAFSVEAARALLDHKRPHEAEPFARRAVSLDPSPENEALLHRTVEAQAVSPVLASGTETAAASPEATPPAEDGAQQTPQPGLFSRIFRHRG